jgi:hypothetical protein
MQHGAHFLWREIEVGLALVAGDETVPVAVPLDDAWWRVSWML